MQKGEFTITREEIASAIDGLRRSHKHPPEDCIIQLVENAIDAINNRIKLEKDGMKRSFVPRIDIYSTTLNGFSSFIVEDNGIGMNADRAIKYANIGNSIKKFIENSLGWQGYGKLAYIPQALSGTFLDTHYFDGSYKELIYAILFEEVNECSLRSYHPDNDAWQYYDNWIRDNHKEMKEGTRVLLWYVKKDVYDGILKNGSKWIARKFPGYLNDIQIYFNGERISVIPPTKKWEKSLGNDVKIGKKTIIGRIQFCEKNIDDNPGIEVRASNRTILYTDFGVDGYNLIKKKIYGYIDLDGIIDKSMMTPAKDELLEIPIKHEIWMKMRIFLECLYKEWEKRLLQEDDPKPVNGFKHIEKNLLRTFIEFSIIPKTRSSISTSLKKSDSVKETVQSDEETPYHYDGEEKEDHPIKKDNKKYCSECEHPFDLDPDETGFITDIKSLNEICPCGCGQKYKKHVHQGAIGKKYRKYICKNPECGHQIIELVSVPGSGFGLEFPTDWKDDQELEFVYKGGVVYINRRHPSFVSSFKESKRMMKHDVLDKISEKDADGTPLEFHVLNCTALAYVQIISDKQIDRDTLPKLVATFKAKYIEKRNENRGEL